AGRAQFAGAFQAVLAQQNSRQVVRNRTETGNAQRFTLEVLEPIYFGLDVQPVVRLVGGCSDPDDGSTVQDCIDDSVSRSTSTLQVASDQRLHNHRSPRNENELPLKSLSFTGAPPL